MENKKCKVVVYNCKTGKMKIEERDMPIYEPTPPKPSQIETVIYNICSVLKNNKMSNDVIEEFIKIYENRYVKR